MTNKTLNTLCWAAGAALAVAAVSLAVNYSPAATPTPSLSIPDRWQKLRSLHPVVQGRFLTLFRAIEQRTGCTVKLNSTYRADDNRQAYHFFGLAADVNVELPNGTTLLMADANAKWEDSGVPAVIRSMGFRWGGDFWMGVSPNYPTGHDPVHIDAGRDYDIAWLRTTATQLAAPLALAKFDGRKVPLTA